MVRRFDPLTGVGTSGQSLQEGRSPDRALKDFCYVVSSVNESARNVWADLWKELEGAATPAGLVMPETQKGFRPSCGWPEFLEKFWLLKHYLDYVHHFCTRAP
jgi:hypothetical protein